MDARRVRCDPNLTLELLDGGSGNEEIYEVLGANYCADRWGRCRIVTHEASAVFLLNRLVSRSDPSADCLVFY